MNTHPWNRIASAAGLTSLTLLFVLAEPSRGQWTVNPANGHEYRLTAGLYWGASDTAVRTPPDWWDAEAEAVAFGGHLVTINDAAESDWLVATFGGTTAYHIGLTDWGSEGSFHWSSAEPVTFLNWDGGQPDNAHAGGEDIVHMNHHGTPGVWNDLGAQGNSPSHPSPYRGIIERPPQASPYCFGDGTGTACPCGSGAGGNGCPSSVNASGANLSASGAASTSADTLVLSGSGMPNSSALYFQGTTQTVGGAGVVFGDGLRCVGGAVTRLGTKSNTAGASQYPGAGDSTVSVRGLCAAGDFRTYQVWYRNAAVFCTPGTWNLTNGLSVTWTM